MKRTRRPSSPPSSATTRSWLQATSITARRLIAAAVDTAPFYAIRTTGNFLVTINGIVTDTDSRALRQDGTVIEGLYVCGNDQGGFYPHGYPSEFTGVNAGRCGCFARIAAKHACGIA